MQHPLNKMAENSESQQLLGNVDNVASQSHSSNTTENCCCYFDLNCKTSYCRWIGRICKAITCVVVTAFIIILITAYAIDLGGTVRFQHNDHTTCQLSVDDASGGRISDLINQNEVKLFYLNLTFPPNVNVSKTDNIYKETTMVWTFRNNPEEGQFLDFPTLYMVWSLGLLDQHTYRHEELVFETHYSQDCSIILGTEETTLAIVKALSNLTLAIANGDSRLDRETKKSVWCQTYKKEDIPESKLDFARIFRFYFSDLRYRCCHLEFNMTSKEFQEVCDQTFRPFPKYWSFLAYFLSIMFVWFFPFMFKFTFDNSYDQKFVYYDKYSPLTSVGIIFNLVGSMVILFKQCCIKSKETNCCPCCKDCLCGIKSKVTNCCTHCKDCLCGIISKVTNCCPDCKDCLCGIKSKVTNCCPYFLKIMLQCIVYFGLIFPSCSYIMYIIFLTNPEGADMLSDYKDNGYALALSESSPFGFKSGPWISDGAVLFIVYLITSLLCFPIFKYSYDKCNKPLTPSMDEPESNWLLVVAPLLFTCCRVQENVCQIIRSEETNSCCKGVLGFFVIVLFPIWFATLVMIAFKSCMYIFLFFSFGVLSILAYPETKSIFIYIFAGIAYILKCLFSPGHQYSIFLKHIIDVMEKDDNLKEKIKTDNPNGDIAIDRDLFIKLVKKHEPMTNMLFFVSIKMISVVAVLFWAGKSVLEVDQWKDLGLIEDAVIAFILTKIPLALSIIFVDHKEDVLKRRLKNDILKHYFFQEHTSNDIQCFVDE